MSALVRLVARALSALVLFGLVGCGRTQPRPPPSEQRSPARFLEEGIASHYHARFTGRKTASGVPYRPNEMTAAHLRLPFGTVVRVTRIDKHGRRVAGPIEVVINDRGPYAKGRVIDRSERAARQLGLYNDIARVRLEIVSSPRRRP
ncbi:MAG TPA: septal ring lytic transglycosylase RlpA family protein [Polyangia bacterium]